MLEWPPLILDIEAMRHIPGYILRLMSDLAELGCIFPQTFEVRTAHFFIAMEVAQHFLKEQRRADLERPGTWF
ncbi:hypothetical protein [Aestuariivirga sp.]|uniref:hypothetical protein n=1 Tax=Aestuariivirga sp. TaxID=2650926 RepID=UPI003783A19A